MRNLYESILRPDDDVTQSVEFEAVLKKYGWWYKTAKWEGKTLCVSYPSERVYLDDLDKVAEELHCRSFKIYPWAIIKTSGPLDGLEIQAGTRIDITAPKVTGCKFTAQQGVTISPQKDTRKLEVTNCDFNTTRLCFDRMDGVALSGNNFNQITYLTLKHVGSKIERIVLGWNLITIDPKGRWSTYPYPKGQPDPNMDPFKSLGLNKHFKNLTDFAVAAGTGGDDEYISFSTRYKQGAHDWGVMKQVNLNSGWQCNVIKDARCI